MNDARRKLVHHLRLIDEGVAPVVARYRQQIECRPGCSDCCRQTFEVSTLEGEYLREGLAALPPDQQTEILERAERYIPGRELPCPVLSSEGRCQLYEYRPRICRKYGIPLWHPDRPHEVRTCPKNFRGTHDLDAELILEPQAQWAEDWLLLQETLRQPTTRDTIAGHLVSSWPPGPTPCGVSKGSDNRHPTRSSDSAV